MSSNKRDSFTAYQDSDNERVLQLALLLLIINHFSNQKWWLNNISISCHIMDELLIGHWRWQAQGTSSYERARMSGVLSWNACVGIDYLEWNRSDLIRLERSNSFLSFFFTLFWKQKSCEEVCEYPVILVRALVKNKAIALPLQRIHIVHKLLW